MTVYLPNRRYCATGEHWTSEEKYCHGRKVRLKRRRNLETLGDTGEVEEELIDWIRRHKLAILIGYYCVFGILAVWKAGFL